MVHKESQRVKKVLATAVLIIVLFSSTLSAETVPAFPLSQAEVTGFDRLFMQNYSENLDKAATVLEIASLLTPAVLLAESTDQYVTIGVMYAETALIAWGTRTLLKTISERPRPYMYYEDYPQTSVDSGDWNKSFPSGHAVMSFAGASFASYVFCKYNPDSKWRIPVIAASYTLASATAALRVASGNHFMTDVLAGAVLGTAIGIGVPALHTLLADKDAAVSVSPFGLVFSMSFR